MAKYLVIGLVALAIGAGVSCSQQQGGKSGGFPPSVIASTEVTQEDWQPSLQSVGTLVATNGINVSSE
ncbi:hypothetical protein, partial [Kaarinaea lacus]